MKKDKRESKSFIKEQKSLLKIYVQLAIPGNVYSLCYNLLILFYIF